MSEGRVCEKHQQWCPDGVCPYCEPTRLAFVREQQERKLRGLLPYIEALSKANPLLQETPYKESSALFVCGCRLCHVPFDGTFVEPTGRKHSRAGCDP